MPLFPDCEVIGLDYQTFSPWDTGKEIYDAVKELQSKYDGIIVIANSIGAFFCMNAGIDNMIQEAYFISPVVDMEKLHGYELTGEWLRYVKKLSCQVERADPHSLWKQRRFGFVGYHQRLCKNAQCSADCHGRRRALVPH